MSELAPAAAGQRLFGRARTDARRGAGVFVGLSPMATHENAEEVLSDALIERFLDGLGAGYAWVFHYMPIGRASTPRRGGSSWRTSMPPRPPAGAWPRAARGATSRWSGTAT